MIIHRWVEKYFALLTLGFLALISYLHARGIGLLVASAIGNAAPRPAARATRWAPIQRHATADAILVRNPFDSLTGSFDVRATPPPATPKLAPATTTAAAAGETALLSHVRVVPERSGGSIVGIRLFGIRTDSLLARIGLQNGDRLESINGLSLGTPEQALAAYAQLRAATRLAVAVNRRGKAVRLAYRID